VNRRYLSLLATTPEVDPGVVVCPECGVDFDAFDRPGEPGYFAGEHNRLHHRGNPVAFVTTVDHPAEPTAEPTGPYGWPEGFLRGWIIGGEPKTGKTAILYRLTLAAALEAGGPVAQLDPTGGEAA
jgi:hypothetical protein